MTDPYWRYAASAAAAAAAAPERDGVPRASFPGYLPPDTSLLSSHHLRSPNDLRGTSSDYLQKDMLPLRPGPYGLENIAGIGSVAASGILGMPPGVGIQGFPTPLEDPAHISQRRDVAPGVNLGIPDMLNERPAPLRKVDALLGEESNILFVDGLPSDCTRREVAHLFRPFIGFKEIRVVHKEPRRSRDKATVLCFVEFTDAKCALTAMEALQGYKFDDKKPSAPTLRIQFAHFPFRPLPTRDE